VAVTVLEMPFLVRVCNVECTSTQLDYHRVTLSSTWNNSAILRIRKVCVWETLELLITVLCRKPKLPCFEQHPPWKAESLSKPRICDYQNSYEWNGYVKGHTLEGTAPPLGRDLERVILWTFFCCPSMDMCLLKILSEYLTNLISTYTFHR
jgi:hypothetical protein